MTKRLGLAEDIYIYFFFLFFSAPPVIHYDAPCFLSTLPPLDRDFALLARTFCTARSFNFTVIRNGFDDAFDSFEYMWRCQVFSNERFAYSSSPKLYDPLSSEPSTYIYPAPNFSSFLPAPRTLWSINFRNLADWNYIQNWKLLENLRVITKGRLLNRRVCKLYIILKKKEKDTKEYINLRLIVTMKSETGR